MLRHKSFLATVLVASTVAFIGPVAAQPLNNASIQGAYYVRYLGANVDRQFPADEALSFSGILTFDGTTDANGRGGFTVNGQGISHATADRSLKILTSGVYTVLPGGIFAMDNPFDPNTADLTALYGGVGVGGILTASSTFTNYTDIFVAIPVSTGNSNATLSGTYFLSSLEFQNGDLTLTRDTFFSAAADGNGGFGSPVIKGTALNLNNMAQSQTSPGVTYSISADGSGTLNIPVPAGAPPVNQQLLAGNKVLYVSPDGNFFVAGGSTAYDMILGVKALSGNVSSALDGLYFTAYLANYANGGDFDGLYASQGAASEINSVTTEIAHQRTNYEFYSPFSYDFTTSSDATGAGFPYPLNADGTASNAGYSQYVVGAGGNIAIGSGDGTNYQLVIYVKAPTLTGTDPFLNPQGIQNAANNVPFTAQVAPGELVSLSGTGLSSQTLATPPFPLPTTLGGVSVNLSWVDFNSGKTLTEQAPMYSVSPTQISVLIPYDAPSDGSYLNFQVSNNGTLSNMGTVNTGGTSPGVFTVPPGGVGNGLILHSDSSPVSNTSPAKVGETVQIFVTGLGAVTPAVAAGAAPSATPSSVTDIKDLSVYIDGVAAKIVFAGLSTTQGGLYQLNVTIPSGVTLNSIVDVEISTQDSQNIQAGIPISK